MRQALFSIVIALAACSSQPAPAWQSAAHTQLANYSESYLAGEEKLAGIHFDKALEHISKTGDPALVGRAWLTRCALETAALIDVPCEQAKEYGGDPSNDSYRAMLEGAAVKPDALPEQYRDLMASLAKRSVKEVNDALAGIEEPVSRLIGVGVTLKRGTFDTATLELAVQTASENGWKTPLTAYLLKLKALYVAAGQSDRSAGIEERLKILAADKK